MQDYTHKSLLIVRDNNDELNIAKHIDIATLANEADMGAVLIWDYKGLLLLLPNARIRNFTRLAALYAPSHKKFIPVIPRYEFIPLPTKIGALLIDDYEKQAGQNSNNDTDRRPK